MLSAARYLRTLRYLRPVQIYGRLWYKFHNPKPDLRPPPLVRPCSGAFAAPANKPQSLISPTRFRFLNEEHDITDSRDWNHPTWGKLWLYNLHYFDDLNAVDATVRQDWHRSLISRWVAENPPTGGNGWEPYPISLRIVNWIKWVFAGNVLPPEALASMATQARHLARRMEFYLLGNHLFANAKALVFAGLFFEGKQTESWLERGLQVLDEELPEQILCDGGHFERSPMYHSIILEDVLDLLNILGVYPESTFSGREQLLDQYNGTARKMLEWLKVMSHPDGKIALLNDSAFGVATLPADLAAYAKRLGLTDRTIHTDINNHFNCHSHEIRKLLSNRIRHQVRNDKGNASSIHVPSIAKFTHLKHSGYIRVDCANMVAFLDVAPIGPDYLPGHAHADTLSFELSIGLQRVIVDSGVSQYGDGAERLWQRGTAAHNTVQIDGYDSSEVWGGFRVGRRAYPMDVQVLESEGAVLCAHDGYRNLPGRPTHRREWRFSKGTLEIRDMITGDFRELVGRLHFHPEVKVIPSSITCDAGTIVLPIGQKICWKIEEGRGRIVNTTWHPEFGLSISNQCLEICFIKREIFITIQSLG